MKLVTKYYPKLDARQRTIIEELSFHTTKLYNIANYECREKAYKSYITLEKELKSNWHNAYLHSHTYQQCLKMVEQNWKSYFKAMQDFQANPSKYRGKPAPPKYKHTQKRKNEIIFTNLAVRRRETELHLSLSKMMQKKFEVNSLKVEIPQSFPLPHDATIQQIRIQFCTSKKQWVFLIIYEVDEAQPKTSSHVMAIDLGLDNLAAITFSHHTDNYVICGKSLKALNGYVNKEIARFQSIRMKQVSHEGFRPTNRIQRLWMKRHHFITNTLHQASRYIVKLADQYDVGTIVIGDMKGVKQTNKAKTFVQIPVQRLAQMIVYKAQMCGIKTVYQQERYTSGVSAFDLEPINQHAYNHKRRLKRGLFRSNTGLLVNADINGSLNIMRLHLKEKGTPKLIELVRDNGCVIHPRRIRVA